MRLEPMDCECYFVVARWRVNRDGKKFSRSDVAELRVLLSSNCRMTWWLVLITKEARRSWTVGIYPEMDKKVAIAKAKKVIDRIAEK